MSALQDPAMLALLAGIFVLAGTVKGTVGIGLPTASVGMMSQFVDPRLAIALVVVPSLLSNAWQIWRLGGLVATARQFWPFLTCITAMIMLVSVTFAATIRTDALILALGFVIVLFSIMSLAWAPPFLAPRWDRVGQVLSGTTAGIMGGLTAIWAPAMVPYLMARRFEPTTFMRATGVMIFVGTIPLIVGYAQAGLITGQTAVISTAMVLPAILGFQIGERLRTFLDPEKFRRAVLWIFLLMGLNLIRRAMM